MIVPVTVVVGAAGATATRRVFAPAAAPPPGYDEIIERFIAGSSWLSTATSPYGRTRDDPPDVPVSPAGCFVPVMVLFSIVTFDARDRTPWPVLWSMVEVWMSAVPVKTRTPPPYG